MDMFPPEFEELCTKEYSALRNFQNCNK